MITLDSISTDLQNAMKNRQDISVRTLKMLKAELQKEAVKGQAARQLTPEDAQAVVRRLVKQRKESADMFEKAGRKEAAEAEREEIQVLQAYLPSQMSEEEVEKVVADIIANIGEGAALGQVMGKAMGALSGKADGAVVQQVAKRLMQS